MDLTVDDYCERSLKKWRFSRPIWRHCNCNFEFIEMHFYKISQLHNFSHMNFNSMYWFSWNLRKGGEFCCLLVFVNVMEYHRTILPKALFFPPSRTGCLLLSSLIVIKMETRAKIFLCVFGHVVLNFNPDH